MGRKKKIKIDETENQETQTVEQTESGEQVTNDEDVGNVIDIEPNEPETEKEITPETGHDPLEDLKNLLDDDFSEPLEVAGEKKKRGRKSKTAPVESTPSMVVPPKLFILISDRLSAAGTALVHNLVSKEKIDGDLLIIKDQETIEELVPLAEAALKEMRLQDHPIAVFFGSLVAAQLTKLIMLKAMMKKP